MAFGFNRVPRLLVNQRVHSAQRRAFGSAEHLEACKLWTVPIADSRLRPENSE